MVRHAPVASVTGIRESSHGAVRGCRGGAAERRVAPAEIIGKDEDNVAPVGGMGETAGKQQKRHEEPFHGRSVPRVSSGRP